MNNSGLKPLEFNVLVKPDTVEERTAGGVFLPDAAKDREKHAATKGTIIALAPLAFEDIMSDDEAWPKPGDRCLISRHAGVFVKGEDDVEYRIVKDKDVVALIAPAN